MGGLRRPAGRAGRRQCLCKDADSTPVGALLAAAVAGAERLRFFWLARGVALGMARAWAACSVLHLRCKIASEIRAVLHLRIVFARFGDEGSGFSTTKPSASRASCFNDENDDDF